MLQPSSAAPQKLRQCSRWGTKTHTHMCTVIGSGRISLSGPSSMAVPTATGCLLRGRGERAHRPRQAGPAARAGGRPTGSRTNAGQVGKAGWSEECASQDLQRLDRSGGATLPHRQRRGQRRGRAAREAVAANAAAEARAGHAVWLTRQQSAAENRRRRVWQLISVTRSRVKCAPGHEAA